MSAGTERMPAATRRRTSRGLLPLVVPPAPLAYDDRRARHEAKVPVPDPRHCGGKILGMEKVVRHRRAVDVRRVRASRPAQPDRPRAHALEIPAHCARVRLARRRGGLAVERHVADALHENEPARARAEDRIANLLRRRRPVDGRPADAPRRRVWLIERVGAHDIPRPQRRSARIRHARGCSSVTASLCHSFWSVSPAFNRCMSSSTRMLRFAASLTMRSRIASCLSRRARR